MLKVAELDQSGADRRPSSREGSSADERAWALHKEHVQAGIVAFD